MPVWPVATNAASTPARRSPRGDLDRRDHLAATAIVADGVDAEAVGANAPAVGHVPLVVAAEVDQLAAVPRGGLGQLAILGEELVHARR